MRFLRECSHGWKPCTVTEHQDVVRQKTLQGGEYLPQFEDGRGQKRVAITEYVLGFLSAEL